MWFFSTFTNRDTDIKSSSLREEIGRDISEVGLFKDACVKKWRETNIYSLILLIVTIFRNGKKEFITIILSHFREVISKCKITFWENIEKLNLERKKNCNKCTRKSY